MSNWRPDDVYGGPRQAQVEPPEWVFKRQICNEINKILPIKHMFHGGEYCKIEDANKLSVF
ncbi:hypothetical protein GGR57DRAFT_499349 [Xylariaceae sp. FL1272]|nr:hypothetical protein GGR57DRAFT_499349 [Xylariaceae sp. FL1272]